MNNCVKKNGKPHSELVCTDEPGLALLKSKTVPIVDRDIELNIIGTDRTKLAEISIDTSKLNNPTILVMFSGLYVPFAAIHLGARITLYKQTGIKNNKKCCSQRDDNGDRGDVLLSHPLRAIQINLSEDDFVFTADQFSYMYTDAVGNYGVSDVCDEDSGIVRYSLYLERGPEINIDGDLKNITLAALAVEKN